MSWGAVPLAAHFLRLPVANKGLMKGLACCLFMPALCVCLLWLCVCVCVFCLLFAFRLLFILLLLLAGPVPSESVGTAHSVFMGKLSLKSRPKRIRQTSFQCARTAWGHVVCHICALMWTVATTIICCPYPYNLLSPSLRSCRVPHTSWDATNRSGNWPPSRMRIAGVAPSLWRRRTTRMASRCRAMASITSATRSWR